MTHSGKILIVDDVPANLRILQHLLKKAEFCVAIARDGEEALSILQHFQADLILLDIMMPGMDGLQTCRRLKQSPQTVALPVIFMSALEDPDNKVEAFAVGGVDYITKPFHPAEVLARVKSQMALRAAQQQLHQLMNDLEQRVASRTQELQQEIQERQRMEQALAKSEEQFRLTFDFAPIGIAIQTLAGEFVRVNRSLSETLGYAAPEFKGRTWLDFIHANHAAAIQALYEKLGCGEISDFQFEGMYQTRSGRKVYGILQASLVQSEAAKPLHIISQFLNVTSQKEAEAKLHHEAFHDGLTQLANRTLLAERLDLALMRARRQEDYRFAVLFIDLDRFKVINDSLGHQIGDQLLIALARLLEAEVRETDLVARLGGDEFVILLDPIHHLRDAVRTVNRIAERFKAPFTLQGRDYFFTASVGIVLGTATYCDSSELLRDADIAMYRAKAHGRARYEVFDEAMFLEAQARVELERDLYTAVERESFIVHYQPIISFESGKVTGFEALLRWPHETRGQISPAEFIPIAEEIGLIVPLGEWVLRQACTQVMAWQQQHPRTCPLKLNVNVSVQQLREVHFIERLQAVLQETGFPPSCLTLELTESMLMESVAAFESVFSALRDLGVCLGIDDFGTGYSSLSYLQHLPVNHLKIDRSFVGEMNLGASPPVIVTAIVALAQELNIKAIAEGVEDQAQFMQLMKLSCCEAQGFLFAPALPPHEIETLLIDDPCWLA